MPLDIYKKLQVVADQFWRYAFLRKAAIEQTAGAWAQDILSSAHCGIDRLQPAAACWLQGTNPFEQQ